MDARTPQIPAVAGLQDDSSRPSPFIDGPLWRDPSRHAITQLTRGDEQGLVVQMLGEWRLAPERREAAQTLARTLALGLRERQPSVGRAGLVQGLLQEFALDSREGIALMCLAEALLRIPDAATRDALIRDKLADAAWDAHLGRSPSMFVNAAAWGLLLTGRLVGAPKSEGLAAALHAAVSRCGEPLIRAALDFGMRLMGEQFVTGQTIEEAVQRAASRQAMGYTHS